MGVLCAGSALPKRLHVASARWAFARARRSGVAVGAFVTSDRAVVAAARWAGLGVENPEDYP